MITTDDSDGLVSVKVFGEFTLADFQEFEALVTRQIESRNVVNVLIDLRDMLSATIDVAWEEVKFSRQHAHDFGRIAILTQSQWVAWSAWLVQIFVDAETSVFESESDARVWLRDGSE